MCCFAGPVRSVANTRIFARLTDQGTQFLAYQMKYASDKQNAMILPLPTEPGAGEDAIKFIDLSNYERFFSDLRKGFPSITPKPMLRSYTSDSAIESKAIVVHQVGSFVASFVPSVNDFARLDPQFSISKEVWAHIPSYADYGFAVFQLKELQAEVHPMAFEFQTRMPNSVFFPTVHIHDGQVHEVEHFEHDLYFQHHAYDLAAGTRYTSTPNYATKWVRSKSKAADFVIVGKALGLVDGELLVHCKSMIGNFANKDVILKGDIPARAGALNLVLPGALCSMAALVPIGWFLNRRNKLMRAKNVK